MSIDFRNVGVIEIGTPSHLANVMDNGSCCAWVYPRTLGGGGFGRIWDKSDDTLTAGGWGTFVNANLFQLSIAFTTAVGRWQAPASSVTLNAWQHIAWTFNGSAASLPAFYKNGAPLTVTNLNAGSGTYFDDSARPLAIGNHKYSTMTRGWDGLLDDMRFYDYQLSAQEVQVIANGQGIDNLTNGLLARWQLQSIGTDRSGGTDHWGTGSETSIGNSNSITVPVEAGWMDGDMLMLIVASGGDASGVAETMTTPAGWNKLNAGQTDAPAAPSRPSVHVFTRTASSEPANYAVTGNQSCTKLGCIISIKELRSNTADATSSINTGTSAAPVAPGVTCSEACMLVRVAVVDSNTVPLNDGTTAPTSANFRRGFSATGVGNGCSLIVSSELVPSGVIGTGTFDAKVSDEWGALTFAFLGGQGVKSDYLIDYSDFKQDSLIGKEPTFSENEPGLKYRRGA